MNPILLILLGIVLGGAIGWLLAAARARTELAKSQVDAEGRVKAAEGTLQEVRARVGAVQTSWRIASANSVGFNKGCGMRANRRSRRKQNSKAPGARS